MAVPWMLIAVIVAVVWAILIKLGLENRAREELQELLKKFDIDIGAATIDLSKNRQVAKESLNRMFNSNSTQIELQTSLSQAIRLCATGSFSDSELDFIDEVSEKLVENYRRQENIPEIYTFLKIMGVV